MSKFQNYYACLSLKIAFNFLQTVKRHRIRHFIRIFIVFEVPSTGICFYNT